MTTRATAISELRELAREVLDQRVEHADHHALAHRRGLAGDLRVRVDRAPAVLELERDVRVRVSLPAPPPASLALTAITARWASGSCSTISTVPVNVSPIAPIFTTISAFTAF